MTETWCRAGPSARVSSRPSAASTRFAAYQRRVSAQHAGPASGVLSTVQQVGNALGVALIGIVFYGALGGGVPHAFRGCLIFLIAVELVLAGLVQLLPKEPAGV